MDLVHLKSSPNSLYTVAYWPHSSNTLNVYACACRYMDTMCKLNESQGTLVNQVRVESLFSPSSENIYLSLSNPYTWIHTFHHHHCPRHQPGCHTPVHVLSPPCEIVRVCYVCECVCARASAYVSMFPRLICVYACVCVRGHASGYVCKPAFRCGALEHFFACLNIVLSSCLFPALSALS